jgi:hypothetical protein
VSLQNETKIRDGHIAFKVFEKMCVRSLFTELDIDIGCVATAVAVEE